MDFSIVAFILLHLFCLLHLPRLSQPPHLQLQPPIHSIPSSSSRSASSSASSSFSYFFSSSFSALKSAERKQTASDVLQYLLDAILLHVASSILNSNSPSVVARFFNLSSVFQYNVDAYPSFTSSSSSSSVLPSEENNNSSSSSSFPFGFISPSDFSSSTSNASSLPSFSKLPHTLSFSSSSISSMPLPPLPSSSFPFSLLSPSCVWAFIGIVAANPGRAQWKQLAHSFPSQTASSSSSSSSVYFQTHSEGFTQQLRCASFSNSTGCSFCEDCNSTFCKLQQLQ